MTEPNTTNICKSIAQFILTGQHDQAQELAAEYGISVADRRVLHFVWTCLEKAHEDVVSGEIDDEND